MTDELYLKLGQQVPTFLLLGQNYLKLESGRDPFLAEILRKYGKANSEPPYYGQIFEGEAQRSVEEALQWMQSRCQRFSIPEWLETVASFAWSGVYTSAIDVIWTEAFRSEWRELDHICDERRKPSRSRSKLHGISLFGSVDRDEEVQRPPLMRREFIKRRQVAQRMAHLLPELITPLGLLLIEGYAGENDWLSPEDLFPILDELNSGQAHIFSATDDLLQNIDINDLIQSEKLVLHKERLASYLLDAEEAGYIKLGRQQEEEKNSRYIWLGKKRIKLSINNWNQVSKSAIILDDFTIIPQAPLSPDKRYIELRNFLFESSKKPVWSGYERGFAFSRDFEKKLHTVVERELKVLESQKRPIVLYGATGTGKTIALGALAYSIRKAQKYPVLFIERKFRNPYNYDIDAFFEWTQDFDDVPPTLIVWDGMSRIDDYYELIRFLDGRGRRFVLVGSCYSVRESQGLVEKDLIEAPSRLNSSEISRLIQFLGSFDASLRELVTRKLAEEPYFLAFLYRLLPETRGRIRSGLAQEIDFLEQEILRQHKEDSTTSVTALGKALLQYKHLLPEEIASTGKTHEIAGEDTTDVRSIIGLVMVAGQFGLSIPLELLMRAAGKQEISSFVRLLNQIQVIDWNEDSSGNISIAPRTQLEAELITRMERGGAEFEAKWVMQLLSEIRGNSGDNIDIQFAINLIRSVSADDSDIGRISTGRFYRYFKDISGTLRKLRQERGVVNTSLMLQEARLLRRFVIETKERTGSPPIDVKSILDIAEENLKEALEQSEDDRWSKKLRSKLLVELASVVGTKAKGHLESSDISNAINLFEESRSAIFEALAQDSENYYSVGVLAWITRDFLRSDILDQQTQIEATTDILNAFEMTADAFDDAAQQEYLQKRRLEIAEVLGNSEMSEEAFNALKAQGSGAGYYLRAIKMTGEVWLLKTQLDMAQRSSCESAAQYLEENFQAISRDRRTLYLLLRLWWMWKVGKPIFFGERQILPFSKEDWQYCNRLVLHLISSNDLLRSNPSLMYLNGLATFHLGAEAEALQIFNQLYREADYITSSRRRIRNYLASTSNGKPKKFLGEVRGSGMKRAIYVNQFRKEILFYPFEFSRPDIRSGESLEFYIAFSFLGPVAVPLTYAKSVNLK